MKIYINNFNINILSNIMNSLIEQYIDSETYIQTYSVDGIYHIDDSSIKKLKITDNNIIILKKYYEDFTLIVDPSYYTTESSYVINPEHISTKLKRCFFKIDKKSNIKLVIEGPVIEGPVIEETFFTKKNNDNYGIIPNDIYFELPNNIDINDALVKKEIIVFLSLLN